MSLSYLEFSEELPLCQNVVQKTEWIHIQRGFFWLSLEVITISSAIFHWFHQENSVTWLQRAVRVEVQTCRLIVYPVGIQNGFWWSRLFRPIKLSPPPIKYCLFPKQLRWGMCIHAPSLQLCTTLQPQRLSCTRLLRPWDPPGRNTGVGCHAFRQGNFPIRYWTHVSCIGKWVLYH